MSRVPSRVGRLFLCEWRSSRGEDRLDKPGVFGEVLDEVCRFGREVWNEYVKSERRLLAGEELAHGFLSWLGEVVPVSGRKAGLPE